MVDPSRPRKGGIRCNGTLKKGARRGEECVGLVLGKDDLSVVCHNCGKPHILLDLLNEVMERSYLSPEDVFAAVPSLCVKKEERRVKVERGAGYYARKMVMLLNEVFGRTKAWEIIDSKRFIDYNTVYFAGNCISDSEHGADFIIVSEMTNLIGHRFAIVSDDGIAIGLSVRVKNPEYLARAKRFARRLETLTKKIQKTPSQVTVVQDF